MLERGPLGINSKEIDALLFPTPAAHAQALGARPILEGTKRTCAGAAAAAGGRAAARLLQQLNHYVRAFLTLPSDQGGSLTRAPSTDAAINKHRELTGDRSACGDLPFTALPASTETLVWDA
jgi:hypothetical protein